MEEHSGVETLMLIDFTRVKFIWHLIKHTFGIKKKDYWEMLVLFAKKKKLENFQMLRNDKYVFV